MRKEAARGEDGDKLAEATASMVLTIFDILNRAIFGGELERPGFILDDLGEANGVKALGCFFATCREPGIYAPYICMNPYAVNALAGKRIAEGVTCAVAEAMLHEMTHYYCFIHGIEDCCANGYHTEYFRDEARAHGLECEWKDGIGWGVTEMGSGWLSIYQTIDDETMRMLGWDE